MDLKLPAKKIKNSGYTIIETMIAISIFLVVVMVGVGSLLNASLLHKKSQDMRSIMDNLSFIMEDISRNLRTGSLYHCIDANDPILTDTSVRDCSGGGWGISFKSALGGQYVYIISNSSVQKSVDGGLNFILLNSSDINVDTASGFFVNGALPPPGDTQQPFVTIKLLGTITSKNNVITPFSLQTGVSERLVDVTIP